MKGYAGAGYHPYYPLDTSEEERRRPYVCRVVPCANGFSGEWFGGDAEGAVLEYGPRGEAKANAVPADRNRFYADGLREGAEYAFRIRTADGRVSRERLVRTCAAPEGTEVVNYLHREDGQYAFSGRYLCSPSLAKLPDGTLVSSMDVFEGRGGQNTEILFRSRDDGKTWQYLCDLYPFFWGSLFVHRGVLYMLGMTTEYGDLQIARSDGGGERWSAPSVILRGANTLCPNGGCHRAPMHMVERNGRLYTSCEYGSWTRGSHLPGVLSIDADADLTDAGNWSFTPFLHFEGAWAEAACGVQKETIEGNIVTAPDGGLLEILRWDCGKALVLRIDPDDPEAELRFEGLWDMPVSNSLFRVLPYRGGWLLITNRRPEGFRGEGSFKRQILSLYWSDDLHAWRFLRDIVNFETEDREKYGVQYPFGVIDGDTLYLLIRAAYNDAHSFHDANTQLFARIDLAELFR